MEQFDVRFHRAFKPSFDGAPVERKRRAFGVDYLHLRGRQSGDLYVTRHGWPTVESLLPSRWFTNDRFRKEGRALAGATGAVYRVPVPHPVRTAFALVVKFSRFGQAAFVRVDPAMADSWQERDRMESGEFLPPFEEFGHLCALRASPGPPIPTKMPLAIYSPPTHHHDWELGRSSHLRHRHNHRLELDQQSEPTDRRLSYHWERLYILLYRWMDGLDAEQAVQHGWINQDTMVGLARTARAELRARGWEVLDHKPRHLILRAPHPQRGLLVRHNRPVWGLVDYELLVPYTSP
jgi:hypothetical protein